MPPPPKLSAEALAALERRRQAFYDNFSHAFKEEYGVRVDAIQLFQPLRLLRRILIASPLSETRLRVLFEHKLPPVYKAVACVLQVLNNGSFEGLTQAKFFTHEIRELLNWMYHAAQQVPKEWDRELDFEWLILPAVRLPPSLLTLLVSVLIVRFSPD